MVESPIRLDDILTVLNWSYSKFYRHKQELIDHGVIFYLKSGQGKYSKKRIHAYESRLKRYVAKQAILGKTL